MTSNYSQQSIPVVLALMAGLAAGHAQGCECDCEQTTKPPTTTQTTGGGGQGGAGGQGGSAGGVGGQGGSAGSSTGGGGGGQGGSAGSGGFGGQGGSAGGGGCAQLGKDACVGCCVSAFETPAFTVAKTAKMCVCSPVGCPDPCAKLCAAATPTLDDYTEACQLCMADGLTSNKGCFSIISSNCSKQPNCGAYLSCLQGC